MSLQTLRQLQIDVFGPCNLRCPTCLIGCGGSALRGKYKGLMSADTLERILAKAKSELPALEVLAMHNWTEPLLHPQLPELIAIAKTFGLYVYVSSNLNALKRQDALLQSGLDKLAVSVSAAEQALYGVYHQAGDIRVVKENMRKLAAARDRTASHTRLVCIFHRYRDNRVDESMMAELAGELGFEFAPTWAFFTPVEKLLASQAADKRYQGVEFRAQDQDIARRLAVPIEQRLERARAESETPCIPLYRQIPINVSADVQLCCASGFRDDTHIGSVLEMSLAEIQETRETHGLCKDCGACGIPSYYHIADHKLDDIGLATRKAFERATSHS